MLEVKNLVSRAFNSHCLVSSAHVEVFLCMSELFQLMLHCQSSSPAAASPLQFLAYINNRPICFTLRVSLC